MASSWILFAIYLLTSLTTPVNGTHQQYKRSELFKLGENASLSCINKTWNQIIYILWRVSMNGVNCSITKEAHGPVYSSCSNRVTLYNKTSGESQLHIAHFQLSDEGTYHCEVAYNHGNYLLMIAVNAIVSPVLSAQLYSNGSHRFAVCSAHGGKPAANVSWEVWWSSPTITVQVRSEADTSSNITAWLELPDNVTRGNISCIATHTSWLDRRSVTLNLNEKQPSNGSAANPTFPKTQIPNQHSHRKLRRWNPMQVMYSVSTQSTTPLQISMDHNFSSHLEVLCIHHASHGY
ncbi:cell surface glycoprotein CD200 receptor 1-B isoform X3 [Denticeps clupeoides]|uniref:cell surface glycoprotein CD200 receptor 1-B isoform X3 n=1 Tax=Denticeps clupeoides TaxID=299321 RepID=UPI0010A55ECF|nr:cell surface glycoprotein CD200 receptor 1-B-like isoform X3 [Denticeps clupeoides]